MSAQRESADLLHITPTLSAMAGIYALSREGGPRSPRFTAYVARVEHEWGLSAYNPMAGAAALDAVNTLLALDAERIARESAREVMTRCGYDDALTLALVVASKGMWTDRFATEAQHRTTGERRDAHGLVLLWAGEALTGELVRRESAAEVVRTMWTSRFGAASTLGAVLAREGLACALSASPATSHPDDDTEPVEEAMTVLGDTDVMGDIVGVLYGDAGSIALGWTPLGLGAGAGFRWAAARAAEVIARDGAREALRTTRTLGSGSIA